ncbi:MAG: hypothetical protein WC289_02775 [Patescibacteria group bacterium]|jgi:hypothetical protein
MNKTRLLLVMIFALVASFAVSVTQTQAAEAPKITSISPQQITADQEFVYAVQVSSTYNADELTFSLSNQPDGMMISDKGVIAWNATTAGEYRVAVGVTAPDDGFTAQPFRFTVVPGSLYDLVISPNDKPTQLANGASALFTPQGKDQDGNTVALSRVTWSTSGDIGTINQTGQFTATRSAVGKVTARVGNVEKSVGVIVTGSSTAAVSPSTRGQVLGESIDEASNTENPEVLATTATTDETTSTTSDTSTTSACSNWQPWIIFTILIAYAAALAGYLLYVKRRPFDLWWIFPILLTIVGLIIYSRFICEGTYQWWPWVLLGAGIALTFGYFPKTSNTEPKP